MAVVAAGIVFVVLLGAAAVFTWLAATRWVDAGRMAGPVVKRLGGFALVAVGAWFLLIASVPEIGGVLSG